MVPVPNFLVGYTLGVDLTSPPPPNFSLVKGRGKKKRAKLTFCLWMDLSGESCLELSPNLKFLERGEEANFFVFGHFLCFNNIFLQVFAYGG